MKFISAELSKAGARETNEDCVGHINTGLCSCYIVADGLGGHNAGEAASKICVDTLSSYFKSAVRLSAGFIAKGVDAVQNELLKQQRSNPNLDGMRTTFAAMITDGRRLYLAYAGDTRFYRFSGENIVYQSADHSVPQQLYSCGLISKGEIRHHEDRNRLLRVLGSEDNYRPVIYEFETPPSAGDRYLLCTDGFWEPVDEGEMEIALQYCNNPHEWLDNMDRVISTRLTPSSDNYSAIMVFAV